MSSTSAPSNTQSSNSKAKWIALYPSYINSKKTIAEGRRIPITQAVDNPTAVEISEVLKHLGFECILEVCLIVMLLL